MPDEQNWTKTAAMYQQNNDYSYTQPYQCDNAQCEGQIKLACGCMLPVVAGAMSPNGQNKLKNWQLQMTPCCEGQVNGISTMVLRDTGSTTCVVKSSLIKPEQMTGTHELCMLIDGVVKRYPTAVVELKTPYYTGKAKVLCMENPVQEIIIGNIPGALGAEVVTTHHTDEVTQCVNNTTHDDQWTHKPDQTTQVHDNMVQVNGDMKQTSDELTISCDKSPDVSTEQADKSAETHDNTNTQLPVTNNVPEECAAVQTRAMVAKENKPPKPLKVKSVPGLDIGPDELKEKQKTDPTLKKYWELADKPSDNSKQQFITKKGILYRKYCGKNNTDNLIQLVNCVKRLFHWHMIHF